MMDAKTLSRFERMVLPEPNSGCWLWMGSLNRYGYAQIGVRGKNPYAHRVSYEHFKGAIPDGMQIDHLCRVRSCVNPVHLDAVTSRENTMRGRGLECLALGRSVNPRFKQTASHCKWGHPLEGENLGFVLHSSGKKSRYCKTCKRQRDRSPSRLAYEKNKRRGTMSYMAKCPNSALTPPAQGNEK